MKKFGRRSPMDHFQIGSAVSDKNIFQIYDESIFFSKKKSLENGIKGGKIQLDIKG